MQNVSIGRSLKTAQFASQFPYS